MSLGMLIRKVKTEDREQILAVLNAAFGQPDEAEIVERLWRDDAVKFERIAEKGGVVVGHIAYSAITTRPAIDGDLFGLAPLAVAPDNQGQGVGAALVEETLRVCIKDGARLIAVLGDPAYYSRFGFETASHQKMRWSGGDAGDAFQLIVGGDIDTDETHVIYYHPAFDPKD